jgi:hypothetical protein
VRQALLRIGVSWEQPKMKHLAAIVALAIGGTFPVLAETQPTGTSQASYLPSLADIMSATQLRHFKLWYASHFENWELANYELSQIKASIHDAIRLYPNIPVANMTTMIQPLEEMRSAIETRNRVTFIEAFRRLTSECNSCHRAAGIGFVVIREPMISPMITSPFSNQSFLPR